VGTEREQERAAQKRITELTELQTEILAALNQKDNKSRETQLDLENQLDRITKKVSEQKAALRKIRRARSARKKRAKKRKGSVKTLRGGAPGLRQQDRRRF
jgi:hypothetical protein